MPESRSQSPSSATRRDFVKAAGAAAITAPAIQTLKGANNQVQYGFIGTGSRGQHLLGHLSKIDTGRCVAMCDLYEPNLKKGVETIGQKPAPYKDYRELLSRKDVECVYIATPLFTHFSVMKDALEAGKHVFCEKSLVFKPEEVHALRALSAARPNQIIQVGLQRRYSKFYQLAEDMIRKGTIGQVTHMRGMWHRNSSWRRPLKDASLERQVNWRMYREYSGGLCAELASHQIDVADRVFDATPEFVVGVGGLDFWKDGRDIYDNVQLIYSYPKGQKLVYTSITTNAHLDIKGLDGMTEFGEVIMGTLGTIEITLGKSMWYREPNPPAIAKAGQAKENWTAGATVSTGKVAKGFPLLAPEELVTEKDSFLEKELKFGKRWLYSKGIVVPDEERDPVAVSLDDFLQCVRDKKKPRADLEVGLQDSIGVMLSNLAMDEKRRVYYNEIEKMGKGAEAKGKRA